MRSPFFASGVMGNIGVAGGIMAESPGAGAGVGTAGFGLDGTSGTTSGGNPDGVIGAGGGVIGAIGAGGVGIGEIGGNMGPLPRVAGGVGSAAGVGVAGVVPPAGRNVGSFIVAGVGAGRGVASGSDSMMGGRTGPVLAGTGVATARGTMGAEVTGATDINVGGTT